MAWRSVGAAKRGAGGERRAARACTKRSFFLETRCLTATPVCRFIVMRESADLLAALLSRASAALLASLEKSPEGRKADLLRSLPSLTFDTRGTGDEMLRLLMSLTTSRATGST